MFSTEKDVENVDNFSPKKAENRVILRDFSFYLLVFHILIVQSEFSTVKEEKVYFSDISAKSCHLEDQMTTKANQFLPLFLLHFIVVKITKSISVSLFLSLWR